MEVSGSTKDKPDVPVPAPLDLVRGRLAELVVHLSDCDAGRRHRRHPAGGARVGAGGSRRPARPRRRRAPPGAPAASTCASGPASAHDGS